MSGRLSWADVVNVKRGLCGLTIGWGKEDNVDPTVPLPRLWRARSAENPWNHDLALLKFGLYRPLVRSVVRKVT